jgi:chemotaxis protein MotB
MAEPAPEVKIKFIKKKGGHAAAHGGAWKVAYADLVTAMMAFFLLMWLLSSANANTKAGIAGMFQDANFFDTAKGKEILDAHGKGILPGGRGMAPIDGGDEGGGKPDQETGAKAEQEESEKMQATAAAIEQAFTTDQLLQAFKDQISMDFTEEGLRIQIQDKATQVLFDSGSARIKPQTLAILKEIAKELGKLPNHVVVGGHTDSQQYAGAAYTNWELSADRANAARRAMEASGLRSEQVKKVTGYAHTKPMEGLIPTDPKQRRISIVVLNSATEAAETQRQKVKPPKEKSSKKTADEPPDGAH